MSLSEAVINLQQALDKRAASAVERGTAWLQAARLVATSVLKVRPILSPPVLMHLETVALFMQSGFHDCHYDWHADI